jgi:glutamate racemase
MKIGFFDTGLGGATIFKEAYKKINGDFIYLADTKNSPYGVKDFDTVRNLTEQNMITLMNYGCKIIVLACNTATSAAISFLRAKYPDIILLVLNQLLSQLLKIVMAKKLYLLLLLLH